MIQRKQSVYLLLACIAQVLFIFCGSMAIVAPAGANAATINLIGLAQTSPLYGVSLVLAAVGALLSAIAVFGYRNRPRQARMCAWNAVLTVASAALFGLAAASHVGTAGVTFRWAIATPLFAIIFELLARHCILSDERLVRAADRLR